MAHILLTPVTAGAGRVERSAERAALRLAPASAGYHNAQLCDYAGEAGRLRFRLQPPLTLSLTAQVQGGVPGTAGFGLWNHPFAPGAARLPCLPRAAWFFCAAPPGNLALAQGVPGHGWKCALIDALNPRALALAPLALPAMLAMRVPALYRRWYPAIQRALRIDEHPLPPGLLAETHRYRLRWLPGCVRFEIDDVTVFESGCAPGGPLGVVIWIDNQYAIVTPQGRFGWGVSPVTAPCALTVTALTLTPG